VNIVYYQTVYKTDIGTNSGIVIGISQLFLKMLLTVTGNCLELLKRHNVKHAIT